MSYTEQRRKLRAVLSGSECLSPASVYDPLSARTAEAVGYELAVLPGSEASQTSLAAPDLVLITLTEFAEQIRRIMRVTKLSLFADADHGYGNALNVMRTVSEFEHAGVAGLSIEDTVLPTPFGVDSKALSMISVEEAVGKVRAAVEARQDPLLVIAARTSALRADGLDAAIARSKAYADAGADAIYVVGFKTLDELNALHAAVKLPLVLGSAPSSLKRADLAASGARILLRGHHEPVAGVIKILRDVYAHLLKDGDPRDLKDRVASKEEINEIVRKEMFGNLQRKFLQ